MEEIKKARTDHCKPTQKDPRHWISNFGGIFPTSQDAFTEFLKGKPLSIDKAKIWDEQLKSFINYTSTIRNNPGHRFTSSTLVPKATLKFCRGPEVITIQNMGPTLPRKKSKPPLPP